MADKHALLHHTPTSDEAAAKVAEHLNAIEEIMRVEGLKPMPPGCAPLLPEPLRWRIMVLGCSFDDHNLWIKRLPDEPGEWWELCEVETGCCVQAVTARECCEVYFKGVNDVLDHHGTGDDL